jgi:membrane protease YdiL (CAAX protease family)
MSRFFRWQPSRETLVAAGAGLAVIGLSAAMIPAQNILWLTIGLRDVAMILGVGILLPLAYILRRGDTFAAFGLRLAHWRLFLPINLALGVLLLLDFLRRSPPPEGFVVEAAFLWKAGYVLAALFFELIFFYAFLRTIFERAFGAVPAILLTALFYSFHHAGFEPMFGKLFLVGVLYATTYRLGNSALLLFPFFLGVGGIYDVCVQGEAVSPIPWPGVRCVGLVATMALLVTWTHMALRQRLARGAAAAPRR